MEYLSGYYLMPHPPIIMPEIGRGEETKIADTKAACEQIGREISELKPETVIIISPHGVMFSDAIALSSEAHIEGSFAPFHAPELKMSKEIDVELTEEIMNLAKDDNILTVSIDSNILNGYKRKYELDHGSMVPLSFVDRFYDDYKLVHITYGMLSEIDLYKFGMKIREACDRLKRKSVIIASGDLSHRLSDDGPYTYSPNGKVFDETLLNHLKIGNVAGVFGMDRTVNEDAGECGLRSVYILLGTIPYEFEGNLLSYQGPFGVGYGVMKFVPKGEVKDYLDELEQAKAKRLNDLYEKSDEYVKLARASIEYYFSHDEEMDVPLNVSSALLKNKAGVFVSLKKFGALRGCIGTFLPATDSIAAEIIRNAVEAAFNDPRFNPLSPSELEEIDISVDVLTKPVKAEKTELDPKRYGVIVSQNYKRGLLLPDLENVDTVDDQLEIACEKAGIAPGSPFDIQKFSVVRHVEGQYGRP